MKFWLYDILACPIDKHYPLKLYIFSYENSLDEFNLYIDIFKQRDISKITQENVIRIEKKENDTLIKDDVIIEANKIENYLRLILKSIDEFDYIYDRSSNELSKDCMTMIQNEIKKAIQNFLNNLNPVQISEIIPELFFLNKIKVNIEIESGVLFCPKCKRWFPIIETIPQMLPDEFRKEEEELKFLKTIRNLLDEEFFKQDLKPYNL